MVGGCPKSVQTRTSAFSFCLIISFGIKKKMKSTPKYGIHTALDETGNTEKGSRNSTEYHSAQKNI